MKKAKTKKRRTIVPICNPITEGKKRTPKKEFKGGYYMKSISKYHS